MFWPDDKDEKRTVHAFIAIIVLLVVAALLLIHSSIQPTTQAETKWGEAVQGMRCRLRAVKPVWELGEIPALILEFQNQGNVPWAIRSQIMGNPQLQVDGVWYERTRAQVNGMMRRMVKRVQPGRTSKFEFSGNLKLHNSWLPCKAGQRLSLSPGKHLIRVSCEADPAVPLGQVVYTRPGEVDAEHVRMVSNPIEIEIVADGWDHTKAILAIEPIDPLRLLSSRTDAERVQQRYARVLTQDEVLKKALENLRKTRWYQRHSRNGSNILEELRNDIRGRPGPGTAFLTITVAGTHKDEVAEIANVIAQAAVDNAVVPEIPEYRKQVERVQAELKVLQATTQRGPDKERAAARKRICELRMGQLNLGLLLHGRRAFSIRVRATTSGQPATQVGQ